MKRVLLVAVAVSLLIAFAVGLFLVTFDADRYRPWVVSQFERAIGQPVRLDRLALGWRQGIALQLDGFAIVEDAAARGEPLLQVASASALVQPLPLLQKEVRVSSIILDTPRIHISRDAQGHLNLLGLAAAAGAAAAPGRTAAAGDAVVSLDIDSLRITGGTLHWTDAMTRPPTDLWIKTLQVMIRNIAPGRPMDVEASGALAGETPNLRLNARLTLPGPQGRAAASGLAGGSLERMQLTLERLSLEELLPAALPGEPQLRGRLTVAAQGRTTSRDPAGWVHGLSGSGRVRLDEPVVANLNVLRSVFGQLAMIPGLVDTLEARLPADYQARFAARDTVLAPIDLSMTLDAGAMRFNDLTVQTDAFGLSGAGRVGLDGTLEAQATLRIEPAFSAALIRSVNELSALTNAAGEMEIPLTLRGQAPRLAVRPDVQYVASKVIATKAADLLEGLLTPQEQAPGGNADQPTGQDGGLLGQVLERVLKKQ